MCSFISQYPEGMAASEEMSVCPLPNSSPSQSESLQTNKGVCISVLLKTLPVESWVHGGLHNYEHVKSWCVVVASTSTLSVLKSIVCTHCTMTYNTDWWNCLEKLSKPWKCQLMNEADSHHIRAIITYLRDNESPSATWPYPRGRKHCWTDNVSSKIGHRNYRYQSLWKRASQQMKSPQIIFPLSHLWKLKKKKVPQIQNTVIKHTNEKVSNRHKLQNVHLLGKGGWV